MQAKLTLALEFTKSLAASPRHGADSRDGWAADVVADAAALTEAFGERWGEPAAVAPGDPYAAVWGPPLAMTPAREPDAARAPTERPPPPPGSRPAVVVKREPYAREVKRTGPRSHELIAAHTAMVQAMVKCVVDEDASGPVISFKARAEEFFKMLSDVDADPHELREAVRAILLMPSVPARTVANGATAKATPWPDPNVKRS